MYVWPELPEDVEIVIDDKDIRIDTFRSSGAGGQHVNVTDSAIRITHLPTGLVVSCQNERSQHRNKDSAMKVLKARLYDIKMKENQAKLDQISGVKKEIGFGSQIRSYVLHPYQLAKDHRTKEQVGDVNRVLDGDIDVFIKSYLMKKSSGTLGQATPDEDLDCSRLAPAEWLAKARRSALAGRRGVRCVAAGIFLSRIAGLVRQRVFSHYFGLRTDAADAFTAGVPHPQLPPEPVRRRRAVRVVHPGVCVAGRARRAARGRPRGGRGVGDAGLVVSVLVLAGVFATPLLIDADRAGLSRRASAS